MVNALDIGIVVIFMAIIGAAFFGGVTGVTAAVIAIYFWAIAAATFYRPAAEFARDQRAHLVADRFHLVVRRLLGDLYRDHLPLTGRLETPAPNRHP